MMHPGLRLEARERGGIAAAIAAAFAALAFACGPAPLEHGKPLGGGAHHAGSSGGMGGGDLIDAGGPTGPPPADAGGLCGNDIHAITTNPPNVYFVLDASGSMQSVDRPGGSTRYEQVRSATVAMVEQLGALINVGAAIFPIGASMNEACPVGGEVFPMTPGDGDGDTAIAFASAINVFPNGNTPTAATLAAIKPTVTALAGNTIVVLATDGAPNCNASLVCTSAECIPNIEGCDPQIPCCGPGGNCCAPNGSAGPQFCVDQAASVAAVKDLEEAGVKVHVIGIPGTAAYKNLLNQMALAGGAGQASPPFFYEVDDLDALGAVLATIAAGVISCDFELDAPPEVPNYTNVYLDQMLVKQDPDDGWIWKTPTTVELRGAACFKLKSGQVKQVQVVSGCPTEATK